MNRKLVLLAVLVLFFSQFVFAVEDASLDAIMEPLNKIYDLVKGIISVVAILAITYAGVRFMFSGDNIQAREGSKSMLTYAILGLVVVWIAPLLVGYLTSPTVA